MQIDKMRRGAMLQPAPPVSSSSADDRVNRALLMMEQNISDPIAIADMAARLRISAPIWKDFLRGTSESDRSPRI